MPIFFNRVARINPLNRIAPKRWYPALRTISQVKEKDVARQIADETTLNRKEAEMALEQLYKVLVSNLLSGNSVQLGEWGSFYLTCKGAGSETREEVTAASVKGLNIKFAPGKELKEALKKATFVAAESILPTVKKKDNDLHGNT